MDEVCAPLPVLLFTVALDGITSMVPVPSELSRASRPFSKASKVLSISSRENLTKPLSLSEVASIARFEISHTLMRRIGEPANETNCEPEPRGQLATVPAVSEANCWIPAPPCTRVGTQNGARA